MQRPLRLEVVKEGDTSGLRMTVGEDSVVLDGEDVGDVIAEMAMHRAAMKPAVPDAVAPRHQYHITIDPCWCADLSATLDSTVLFFRHEGLGWTGFAFSLAQRDAWLRELREVSKSLMNQGKHTTRPN